ncbi:response regulator [Thermodesulfobacteriota bacterium]
MSLILIIEDDDQVRSVLRKMIELDGYEVMEASNGEAGISLYRSKPADIIITDIVMPGKDGIETIMDLKIEFPEVKIIAISGGGRFGPETYLEIADGFGADCILSKPIAREKLKRAIRKLIQ